MSLLKTDPEAKAPRRAWRWSQNWNDVFFAHWQVPTEALRGLVPAGLEVDTWHGQAWISMVAFRLDVRLRGVPLFGFCTNFVELNLRTYVQCRGERGIYFLSIHAGHRIPVLLARLLTPLPYIHAPLTYCQGVENWRLEANANGSQLADGEFKPAAEATLLDSGTEEAWLLERYRAFVPNHYGRLYRLAVEHPPWSVHQATAHIQAANLGVPFGLDLRRQPDLVHFSPYMPALLWPFEAFQDGLA